jgi:hypothetical protein
MAWQRRGDIYWPIKVAQMSQRPVSQMSPFLKRGKKSPGGRYSYGQEATAGDSV